ncbi:hypothetical protein DW322_19420 [Rhodococcus rhodnii]|uniref:Uncharacterized protein n=2 Tax=Rhodococcus rhodnii TaxID=38312 RepID=R7WSQ1_9NOCA|nr:hypothetical protein [Rhodococcus rhodnii]EOM77174.1 hypothetical protein Rrhod_1422 [Rhodococcus rhodnii LMG 5362]TXG91952.1 hypothetical protein DW322_19420 [Rhodococcus rhodnii]
MKSFVKRAAVAAAAAAGIAGASVVGAAPAQAQPAPFDLAISGGVDCQWARPGQPWSDLWTMKRWMTVTNNGPGPAPNVTLQEFFGEQRFSPELKPGQSLTIETMWTGCWPASISGYTASSLIDPLYNNVGFWANIERR